MLAASWLGGRLVVVVVIIISSEFKEVVLTEARKEVIVGEAGILGRALQLLDLALEAAVLLGLGSASLVLLLAAATADDLSLLLQERQGAIVLGSASVAAAVVIIEVPIILDDGRIVNVARGDVVLGCGGIALRLLVAQSAVVQLVVREVAHVQRSILFGELTREPSTP